MWLHIRIERQSVNLSCVWSFWCSLLPLTLQWIYRVSVVSHFAVILLVSSVIFCLVHDPIDVICCLLPCPRSYWRSLLSLTLSLILSMTSVVTYLVRNPIDVLCYLVRDPIDVHCCLLNALVPNDVPCCLLPCPWSYRCPLLSHKEDTCDPHAQKQILQLLIQQGIFYCLHFTWLFVQGQYFWYCAC